jgi:hypothetical protein
MRMNGLTIRRERVILLVLQTVSELRGLSLTLGGAHYKLPTLSR